MADEQIKENEGQAAEVEPKPKGGKTMMIIGAGVAMIVVAVVLVVFILFPKYQELTGQDTAEQEEVIKEEPKTLGQVFKIENITINPKGSMGRRFAVFEVALEYQDSDPEFGNTLFSLQPVIMDRFISYLRTKTVMELSKESQIDTIRYHMRDIVNDLVKKEAITHLYFTRFVLE